MLRFALGMVAGALAFHHLPVLPAAGWLLLPLVALPATRLQRLKPIGPGLAGLLLGFASAHLQNLIQAPEPLPSSAFERPVELLGRIDSLVEKRANGAGFQFRVDRLRIGDVVHAGRWRVRLRWYSHAPTLAPGQHWRLIARLKPAHGYANPGGFDYEGWLYRQQIGHTGYVIDATGTGERVVLGLNSVRQWISRRIDETVPDPAAAAVLRALVIGERSGFDSGMRRILQRTGTSHLVAISGLHIGMVASAIGLLTAFCWRRLSRLCGRVPAVHAGVCAGLAGAAVYAALAGFSLPTQRALIMFGVAAVAVGMRRSALSWHAFGTALVVVLLLDGSAVLSAGFWLSFGAVALIFAWIGSGFGVGRRSARRRWDWLALQAVIGLGLAPVLLAAGLGLSVSGLLVNPPAIAWFGLVLIPAALSGALLLPLWPLAAEWLLQCAALGTGWALQIIAFAANWPGTLLHAAAPTQIAILLAALGVALFIAPRGFPARLLAPVLIAPLWLASPPRPALAPGEFALTMLDVGQGLAVVIETARHVLVYDTGNRFSSGFNTGTAVVAPFLRSRGWRRIDLLVVSHDDTDHSGGVAGLLDELPVARLLAGERAAGSPHRPEACSAGQRWRWDGVPFEVVYPQYPGEAHGNDASCVLRVGAPGHAALLTGDIERRGEQRLLAHHGRAGPDGIAARVVTAPHHGSDSSSSGALVDVVQAEFVLYSAGYRNRWGFPSPTVTARWRAAGTEGLSTADSGAIGFVFRNRRILQGPARFRVDQRRFWMHRPRRDQVSTSGVSRPQK